MAEKTNTAKSLVIVESPAKARTLKKYLDKSYEVKASVGHVIDLPEKRLGVKIDEGFEPEYVEVPGKKKVISDLKQAASGAEEIYLASDPDREGEAIAWHIARVIDGSKPIHRVLINEITQKGVQKAIEQPGELNRDLFDAQKARRILDRLVGYTLSPLLGKKVQKGLSAGRVQSVAVRLICEREAEIEDFVPEEYWSVEVDLEAAEPPPFTVKLAEIDGEKPKISDEETANNIVSELQKGSYKVKKIEKKTRRRNPPAPFATATLQQEAAKKFRMSAKKTMTIAQRLYEGLEVGDRGPLGLITYMRTDSVRVSAEAQEAARGVVTERFGNDYLPSKPRQYKSKKAAQEAHEAIRPTDMGITPEEARKHLNPDDTKLYELIYNRFLASQMKAAVLNQLTVHVQNGRLLLKATATTVKFPGFMALYTEGKDEGEDKDPDKPVELPALEENQELAEKEIRPKQHFTQPPPRYTEASLVKELEEKGIGRPSTYAQILSVIQDRGYVEKQEGKFQPTSMGKLVTSLLVESFPEVLNIKFTARMEDELDQIEEGKLKWKTAIEDFWKHFKKQLDEAKGSMRNVKKEREETTDIECEVCGKPMMIKWGRNGQFLACSGFPSCKNTRNFRRLESGEIQVLEDESPEPCPLDGGKLVIRQGKKGTFLGCSNYPDCKFTSNFTIDDDGKPYPVDKGEQTTEEELPSECPECGADLVEKRGRYGKFLACSKYPDCKTTVKIPKHLQKKEPPEQAGENCDKCGKPMVIRKGRYGPFMACSGYPKCRNIKKLPKEKKKQEKS